MDEQDVKNLMVLPIVVLIATGIAIAGSQGGYLVLGIPIFALEVIIAFVIQWIAFIPADYYKTEKFYDLSGAVTYLTVVITAFLLVPTPDTRSIILTILVGVWALRLGTFLFRRVLKEGEDRRFREIKASSSRFLVAWTIQGLWVVITSGAALAAITATSQRSMGIIGYIGLVIWLIGFAIEVIADWEKGQFRANPDNKGKFIDSGLWAWSRHPNYFGEIVLWIGVAIIALPVLSGWQYVTLISPIFVIFLLTKVSGIPMLEERADEKWGGQEDYENYKANTPILIPLPPSRNE